MLLLALRETYIQFTRWSWLDELACRALDERSTSWLGELAIWSFEWCNIAYIHEAARRALVVRSSCARRASSSSQLHRV